MTAERVYQLLLRAFPREFRDDVGGEMAALFRARHRDEQGRGRLAVARFWIRTLWDVARNAVPERIDGWRTHAAPRAASPQPPRGGFIPREALVDDMRGAENAAFRMTSGRLSSSAG